MDMDMDIRADLRFWRSGGGLLRAVRGVVGMGFVGGGFEWRRGVICGERRGGR